MQGKLQIPNASNRAEYCRLPYIKLTYFMEILNRIIGELKEALQYFKERTKHKYYGDRFEEWVVMHSNISKDGMPGTGEHLPFWRLLESGAGISTSTDTVPYLPLLRIYYWSVSPIRVPAMSPEILSP